MRHSLTYTVALSNTMTDSEVNDDNIKTEPDEHDSWSDEEPGIPDWEEYMRIEVKESNEGDLTISLDMLDKAYISSNVSVDLDDWL